MSTRVIPANTLYTQLFGDARIAIVLQQMQYWSKRGADAPWFWKTRRELAAETSLKLGTIDRSWRVLRAAGVLISEEHITRWGKCLRWRVNEERLAELIQSLRRACKTRRPSRESSAPVSTKLDTPQPGTKDVHETTCIDDHNHRTKTISPTPAKKSDAPAASAVVALLMQIGMARSNAERIACEYSEQQIRQQVAYLPYRKATDPAAVLYSSVKHDWAAPVEWEQAQAREREREAEQQRNAKLAEQDTQKKQAQAELQARLEAAWLALSGQQRAELEQQAEERFRVENGTLANWLDDPEKRKSPWVTGPLNTIRKDLLRTRYFTAVE